MHINLIDIEKLIHTVAKHPFASTVVFVFIVIVVYLLQQ